MRWWVGAGIFVCFAFPVCVYGSKQEPQNWNTRTIVFESSVIPPNENYDESGNDDHEEENVDRNSDSVIDDYVEEYFRSNSEPGTDGLEWNLAEEEEFTEDKIAGDKTVEDQITEEDIAEVEITEEDIAHTTDSLLGDLELDSIEKTVDQLLADEGFSFQDTVKALISGEMQLDAQTLVELVKSMFIGELSNQKQVILQIFLLIIVAALLLNVSHIFDKGQISEMAFYMIYLLIFVLLIKSFGSLSGQMTDALGKGVSFMEVLTPAYYLSIIASNGTSSAYCYYQIVLVVIFLVQWLLLKVVVPGINIYVLLGVVNHLSKEDFLSKTAELLKTIMEWMLKSVVALIVGMQVIQRMVSPMLDSLQRSVIGKTASAIPGIGNVVDSVTEMIIGCSMLIRNCIGVTALLVLILLAVGPIVQLGITTLLYRALAAVSQPISDKRLVGCLSIMGEGCGLLLRVLFTAEILFLVTIAIVTSGGG